MTQVTEIAMYNGKLRKVQTLKYRDGKISKRIYAKVDDVVPFDIVWLQAKP